ncbi:MAG: transglutaminase-like domain-containing protein, partial [Planctomycetaceae bacterium]
VFPMVNVKYSTQRKKADQSPLESMESGLASCTGLSVLLVDACRAVGIPARIVGTPLWSDNSGNHTWVEIWDNGWHFTGACEPTGNVLDQGWFIDRASKAVRDERRHAIYAVTFRKNGHTFPMVWARDNPDVFAVNVTDRYTALRSPIPENHAALRVRVIGPAGARAAVDVRIVDAAGKELFRGRSKDDRFDSNDH